jgi:hypothetical protein
VNAEELERSQDDGLSCESCGILIDPGYGEMTYLVGAKEGFLFYHAGDCAQQALRELEAS